MYAYACAHAHTYPHTHPPIHTQTHTHRQTNRQTDRQTHTHTHSRVKSKQKLIIGYQMRQTRRLESRMIWNQIQICPRYIRVTWDSSLLWGDCVHCHGEDQNSNLSWGDCTLPSIAKIRISICPGVPLQNAIGKIEFQSALEWLHTALGGIRIPISPGADATGPTGIYFWFKMVYWNQTLRKFAKINVKTTAWPKSINSVYAWSICLSKNKS